MSQHEKFIGYLDWAVHPSIKVSRERERRRSKIASKNNVSPHTADDRRPRMNTSGLFSYWLSQSSIGERLNGTGRNRYVAPHAVEYR